MGTLTSPSEAECVRRTCSLWRSSVTLEARTQAGERRRETWRCAVTAPKSPTAVAPQKYVSSERLWPGEEKAGGPGFGIHGDRRAVISVPSEQALSSRTPNPGSGGCRNRGPSVPAEDKQEEAAE